MKIRITLLIVVLVVSLSSTTGLFWFFEHGTNPNVKTLFDAAWWWIITSTTVGYGDIVPISYGGRLVGVITVVAGFLICTSFVAVIMESVHAYLERRERGTAQVKINHHVVLCEYTAVADELIKYLPSCNGFANRPVVIVSDLVSRNPYPQHYFVCGVPINPASLRLANVPHADYVFVFANLRFADPDVKTLHTASRVRDLNPHSTIFVEMVNPNNELLRAVSESFIPLDSKKLMEAVLTRKHLDPNDWLNKST